MTRLRRAATKNLSQSISRSTNAGAREQAANRTVKGTFKKGQSGNPGGRPKVLFEVQALARENTETAINTLIDIMVDSQKPAAARVSAAQALLDRGWGKAPATINLGEGTRDLTEYSREELLAILHASREPEPSAVH